MLSRLHLSKVIQDTPGRFHHVINEKVWISLRYIKGLFFVKKKRIVCYKLMACNWLKRILGATSRTGLKQHSPRRSPIHLADLEERRSKTKSYLLLQSW